MQPTKYPFRIALIISFLFLTTHSFAQPHIAGFSPLSGPVGTTVTISGSGFSPVSTDNIVFFGATKAVVINATNTLLTTIVPSGATYEPITVTTNRLTAFSRRPFNITFQGSSISAGSFPQAGNHSAGTNPYGVVIRDFDGDGLSDFAAIMFNSPRVSVFRNTRVGNGLSFSTKIDFNIGFASTSIYSGDIDGDGKMDLLICSFWGPYITILKNTSIPGAISFAAPVNFSTAEQPTCIAIADFELDGKPDIAVGTTSSKMSILQNTTAADGVLAFHRETDYTIGINCRDIAAADLNGDALPDLAVMDGGETISVFKNVSTGNSLAFGFMTSWAVGFDISCLTVGDLDGDMKHDLVAAKSYGVGSPNFLAILRNTATNGDIGFADKLLVNVTDGASDIEVDDMNGDGKPDIITSNHFFNSLSILQNTSLGSSINFSGDVKYSTGNSPVDVATGDLNGDGRPEMTAAIRDYDIIALYRNKNGVNPPSGSISGDAIVCFGSPSPQVTFTAAEGMAPCTFTYSINGGPSQTIVTTSGNTVSISAPTSVANTFTYILQKITDAAGDSTLISDTAVVQVITIAATLTHRDSTCPHLGILQVSGAGEAAQITWYKDSVAIDTVYRSFMPAAITKAGGNGRGDALNQFDQPEGVFVHSNGDIYVSDEMNNRVLKFPANSTSASNGIIVAGGNGSGSAANQLARPGGIFVDAAGNLYVADQFNYRIQKFPPGSTSSTSGVTVAGGNGPGENFPNQLVHPISVFVDKNDNLYVADYVGCRIQKFPPGSTSATAGVTVAGGNGFGSGPTQFSLPRHVFVDTAGFIYVADFDNERIQKFPPNSTRTTNGITVAGGLQEGSAANQLYHPSGVFVDNAGNIFVADSYNHRVQKFVPGSAEGITVAAGTPPLPLMEPTSLYLAPDGDLYVTDINNHRVQKWPVNNIDTMFAPISPGNYYATVFNSQGCSSISNTVIIDTCINQLPLVVISNPLQGATFAAGSNITVQVQASDPDGHIVKVEYYNEAAKFGESVASPYQVTGNGVEPGNYVLTAKAYDNVGAVAVSDTIRITVTACTGSGSILAEGYTGITGTQIANLTGNAKFPNSPDLVTTVNIFEYANFGDNYGGRLRGYICAPATGNYRFYIASDDQSELWLGTDENPGNKVKIAYVSSAVGSRAWTATPSQASASIFLVRGARYYIETLHKEGTGQDHLSVAWRLPNGTLEGPIPGTRLSPWQTTPLMTMKKTMQQVSPLTITAMPNPSPGYFTLVAKTNSREMLTIQIMDELGREMEKKTGVAPGQLIQIGNKLSRGAYTAIVTQGKQRVRVKLVKL